jgi:Outer membrane protein beta-barrel domain
MNDFLPGKTIKYGAAFILSLLLCQASVGQQSSCSQSLRNAQRAYDEGRIAEIPNLLDVCLRGGFNREERIRGYRLLTLSYLYQYETASAEKAMLQLLRVVPDYKLTSDDPAPFRKLYAQFRTHPILLAGIKTGLNFAQPQGIRGYSLDQNNFGKYKSKVGFTLGVNADFFLSNKISLNVALLFLYNRHEQQFRDSSARILGFQQMTVTETQSHLALPVLVKYDFWERKKMTFFAEAGIAAQYLLTAGVTDPRDLYKDNAVERPPSETVGFGGQRKRFGLSGVVGGGLKYKTGKTIFTLDAQYWIGLMNVVKSNSRYGPNSLDFAALFVDNDFRLNNLIITAGFFLPVYKPKLLKKK